MLVSTLVLSAALSVGQCPLGNVAHAAGRIAFAPVCVAARAAVKTVRAAERIATIPLRARPRDPYYGLVMVPVRPATVFVAAPAYAAPSACSGGACRVR